MVLQCKMVQGDQRTSSTDDPLEAVSSRPGRYLLAINWLTDGTDDRVTTGQLREYLEVSPASVSEMISQLDDQALVTHEPYRGVELTPEGEAIADVLAWRLCVVTNFFESVLETDLSEATAYEIGFTLPEAGVCRLAELLAHPCTDDCQGTEQDYDGCLIGA